MRKKKELQTAHTITLSKQIERLVDIESVSSVHAIIFSQRELLVVSDSRGIDIPGGHVEVGETISEALIREIAEEANFIIPKSAEIKFFASLNNGNDSYEERVMLFAVITGIEKTPNTFWLPVEDFMKKYTQTDFKDAIYELLIQAEKYA